MMTNEAIDNLVLAHVPPIQFTQLDKTDTILILLAEIAKRLPEPQEDVLEAVNRLKREIGDKP